MPFGFPWRVILGPFAVLFEIFGVKSGDGAADMCFLSDVGVEK